MREKICNKLADTFEKSFWSENDEQAFRLIKVAHMELNLDQRIKICNRAFKMLELHGDNHERIQ